MSTTKRIAFGAGAQWVSRASSILLGLVLMPVLLSHLPKEEVGLWLLLGQSWAVLGILDLGFSAVLTRRIAIAKGRSGSLPDVALSDESLQEIADLIKIGQRVYRFMAFGVFGVSWALGFHYLHNLELHEVDYETVWLGWTILCASNAVNVWGTVWTCLLQGTGHVGWDGLLTTVLGTISLLAQISAVLAGGGIISLATIAALSAVLQRITLRSFSLRRNREIRSVTGKWNPRLFRPMPGLSLRAWLTSLGGVLVFNTDAFFIASGESAADIPAFRAAFLVALNLHILASALAQASWVFMSQLWQSGQFEEVRLIFRRNLLAGLCFMICGGAAVVASGEALFNLWLGPSNYIGPITVGILVVLFILEQQSYIVAMGCRSTEFEPFAFWMMAAGVLKLVLAPFMLSHFGLMGLAIASLAAQVVGVYWVVLKRGLNRLGFGFSRYFVEVAMPCSLVLIAAVIFSQVAITMTKELPDLWRIVAASSAAGLVLAVSLWLLVLNSNQRSRLSAAWRIWKTL